MSIILSAKHFDRLFVSNFIEDRTLALLVGLNTSFFIKLHIAVITINKQVGFLKKPSFGLVWFMSSRYKWTVVL